MTRFDNPDRGHRAPQSGSGVVRGSGAGAGGGNPGEDYDDDPVAGSGKIDRKAIRSRRKLP